MLKNDAPSPWVARFAPLMETACPVLDLAAGGGRHSLFLASHGHPVTAIDRDGERLREIREALSAKGLRVELLEQDLEEPEFSLQRSLEGHAFGGIVVTNYLHRPLLADLPKLLVSGGVLIYETFALGNERFGRPANPDFLLRPGELLEAFGTLEVIAFEQGIVSRAKKAVIQRICCRQPAGPAGQAPLRAR